MYFHARIKKVLSEGVQLRQSFFVFLVDERIQITLSEGHHLAPVKRHLNGISLVGE